MKNVRHDIAHSIKRNVPFALLTPRMVFTYSSNATIIQVIFSFYNGLEPIMAWYGLMKAALGEDRELVWSYDRCWRIRLENHRQIVSLTANAKDREHER